MNTCVPCYAGTLLADIDHDCSDLRGDLACFGLVVTPGGTRVCEAGYFGLYCVGPLPN